MDAVIGTLKSKQQSILHGDHHIITSLPLTDGLSGLLAGMALYKTSEGTYTPVPSTYTTEVPAAILLVDIEGPTSGAFALAAVHGAARGDKVMFADKAAATAALVEALRDKGIYVLGAVAKAAQAPVIVSDIADASAAAGEDIELAFGVKVNDGGDVTYQWYSNTEASNSGGDAISGATEAIYSPPTDTTGTSYYYCVATNTLGVSTATRASSAATVTIS
jgi:hypothetical protein